MKNLLPLALAVLLSASLSGQSLQDTVALASWMDGVIDAHLRDKHMVGATVSIIKDGKILLAKGYGFSDNTRQKRVSADSTLFRIGSISKMFTWISVMQLVAQGKLDLNADVNTYLKDFQIPPTYPEPITLKHLMTHTPGFEDRVIALFARDSTRLQPLGTLLAGDLPERVRPPGTYASYSNHGTGMAGYIVEQVSGMSFDDYVEKNILQPLGMTRTTFRQPLPANLKKIMSKGYRYSGGFYVEKPFEFVPLYPAGSVASSATDMVPFMRALLENGRPILDSATMILMKTPAHRHHPAVNPMRHGFIDMSRGGVEVIGHGGDTFWFHSMMALFPSQNAGLFISFNTDTGGGVSGTVMEEFIDRYFKAATLPEARKFGKEYLKKFTGKYRANRHSYSDFTEIISLFGDADVSLLDSTGIRVRAGEVVRDLVPIDSLTFREKNKTRIAAFGKNEKGEIAWMFQGSTPIVALYKVSGLRSTSLHLTLLIFAGLTMVLALVFWPFVAWSRIGYQSHRMTKPMPFGARFVAWINYLVLLIFLLGLAANLDEDAVVFGLPTGLKALFYLPYVNMLLTLFMFVWVFRMAGVRYHRAASRIYYIWLTLVAVAILWELYYWHMIGPV